MANQSRVGAVQTNMIRVTELLDAGYPDAGASNMYVTDNIIEIGSNPNFEAGDDLSQKNGGGVVCVSFKGPDSYKFHDMTATLCELDAELLNLLTGATMVSSGGNVVGSQFQVDPDVPYVALEAWQTVVEGGEPTGEYVHWIWPRTRWRQGQTTRNNGILTIPIVGTAFANSNFGRGPAGDYPANMTAPENWYIDTAIPVASDERQTVSTGS